MGFTLLVLGDTLDFLRPGKLASNPLHTYFIDEGGKVFLVMDTDYHEKVAFRVCRYDLPPSSQSGTCCDCSRSVKCEWGVLNNLPSYSVCQLSISQSGLYQFLVYTSQFPCYQNISSPFKIQEKSLLNYDRRGSDIKLSIILACVFFVILTVVILIIITKRCLSSRGTCIIYICMHM